MREAIPSPRAIKFDSFEVDLQSEELYKNGNKIKLQEQPFRILAMLLNRAGEVVTREELRQALWSADTFVDFDHGVNTGIKKIRQALGDLTEHPRFVETLPRHGYRFLVPVVYESHVGESARAGSPEVPSISSEASPIPPDRPAVGAGGLRHRPEWRIFCAAAIAGVTALSAIWIAFSLWGAHHPGITFHQHDLVLVTSFTNATGENVLDGSLEYALERDLSNSTFVSVVPRERVNDTLRLMEKPFNTSLDRGVGREVCLRDGGIRALLIGRVEKLGGTYALSVEIVDPKEDDSVASLSEEAVDREEVPAALRRLSGRVREKLGEALPQIAQGNQSLEKATTPSLSALQLYSHGVEHASEKGWEKAIPLFEEALRGDPQFASAHLGLADCYSNLGRDKLAAPHYAQSFALVDTTPDRERYFILGSYYGHYLKDSAKEIQNYETLVHLYPDHYWGVENLAEAYRSAGLPGKALPYIVRRAELRPHDFRSNYHAAFELFHGDTPAGARPFALRAAALLGPETLENLPQEASWIKLFPATESWQRGDVNATRIELSRVLQWANSMQGEARDATMRRLGLAYATLGNRRLAAECLNKLSDPNQQKLAFAVLAWADDDVPALRKHARALGSAEDLSDSPLPPLLMARAGLYPEARQAMARRGETSMAPKDPRSIELQRVILGEIALARGESAKALELLGDGSQPLGPAGTMPAFLAAESSAHTRESLGRLPEAIDDLEKASAERPRVEIENGFAWMRVQWRLAQLYRRSARAQDARRVESNLLRLLKYADSDFPLLTQLEQSQ